MTHPGITELREQLAGLKREAETIGSDLAHESAEASKWEQRAMDAVRRGDDVAAREALERQAAHAERASVAEQELMRLREMEATCHEFLAAAGVAV